MQALRQLAKELLGPVHAPARDLFWSVFALTERTALLWLGCYVALAFGFYLARDRRPGDAGFRTYLLPPEIYTHPSAKADCLYFAIDKLVLLAALSLLPLSGDALTAALLRLAPVTVGPAKAWESAALTLAVFLAFDAGAFAWHALTHRVPLLWAFHRVHHSVEVLTPLSNYREHPLDSIGRSLTQGALVGLAQAGLLHWLPGARPLSLFGLNAIYVPFFVLSNARHSHLWIGFGPRWSRLLLSPAQHQCHHGTAPEHIDVNYGLVLALWDRLCGTLYVPARREQVQYGLVGEARPFPTVASMYLRPFRDAFRGLRFRRAAGRATARS